MRRLTLKYGKSVGILAAVNEWPASMRQFLPAILGVGLVVLVCLLATMWLSGNSVIGSKSENHLGLSTLSHGGGRPGTFNAVNNKWHASPPRLSMTKGTI